MKTPQQRWPANLLISFTQENKQLNNPLSRLDILIPVSTKLCSMDITVFELNFLSLEAKKPGLDLKVPVPPPETSALPAPKGLS